MPLFNTTAFNNQKSKFGPSMVSYFDETVGELTYLAWINMENDIFVSQVFLGEEITFGEILNLGRKSNCPPSLSINPFIYDSRINVSWVDENEGKVGMVSINVANELAPKNILEADIKTDSSPAIFPFFPDPADVHYRNESCFIYKDKRNNLNWSTSYDGINFSSNPVYMATEVLKSLTAPKCIDNKLIWTDYNTHQLYSGTIIHNLHDGVLTMTIDHVKKIGGMSAASPAAMAFSDGGEIVVCYRGYTYKQLFVQKLDAGYRSIVRQTQLGVESDFSPAVCSFNNTAWIAWTDNNNQIQVAAIDFDKCRWEELMTLGTLE